MRRKSTQQENANYWRMQMKWRDDQRKQDKIVIQTP